MTDSKGAVLEALALRREVEEGPKRRAIVDDVHFALPPGRFVAVMGPSGSGKSTFLHLLAGLERPTAGTVRLLGTSYEGLTDEAITRLRLRHVGFVFQFFHLVPHLSVAENIALPLLLSGATAGREDPRFQAMVQHFGLEAFLDRMPQQLSGGEMQRVSVARALVHEPAVVLADEPTGNLSSRAGQEVLDHLRRAVDELGRSVLLVTHNPRDACAADRVEFLRDGKLESERALEGEAVDESGVARRMEELGL